ncbi:MAG: RsiV family protein [Candidatus Kapaibacteriota bacterium]
MKIAYAAPARRQRSCTPQPPDGKSLSTFFSIVIAIFALAFFCNTPKSVAQGSSLQSLPPLSVKDSTMYCFLGELQDQAKSRIIALQGDINFLGTAIEGKYHYNGGVGIVEIKGKIAKDGSVSINEVTSAGEFSYNPDHKEKITAKITGKLDRAQGVITGSWVSQDGKTTFPCTMRLVARYEKKKHPKLVVSTAYPVFVSPEYAVLNDSLARWMKASFDSSVVSVKSLIEEYKGMTDLSFKPEERLSETDDVGVYHLTPTWVSMSNLAYTDGGGAHGNYGYDGITWQKRGNAWKRVKLQELFTNDTAAYYKKINELLFAGLRKRQASFVMDGSVKDLRDGLRNGYQSWVVRPSGITFIFPPYAVASYAEGSLEVFVPWKALKDYLRSDGLAGEFLK